MLMRGNTPPTTRSPSHLSRPAGYPPNRQPATVGEEERGGRGTTQQYGLLSHPQDLDAPLRLAAQRKINCYRQQYVDNQNISFLSAIVSTSTRMHGEFLRLLFLQAHRETETHFTAAGMSSQRNQSDSFRFKRAAFYQSLKSKVGLVAAKAAELRINLNVEGCGIVAAPVHAPSRPFSSPSFFHTISLSPAFTSA
jgi:hypothetical protein